MKGKYQDAMPSEMPTGCWKWLARMATRGPVVYFCAITYAPCVFAKELSCIECVYDADTHREYNEQTLWESGGGPYERGIAP